MSEAVTTKDIMAALRARFCAPEFALFEEVGDSGSRSMVRADAVAMNMWLSRGYAIHGFEVKASRSDWLRELKQPQKAEPIISVCNFFHLVAPESAFQIDEVPSTWGVLSYADGKLREKRRAPALTPAPPTKEFFAQILRRASGAEERDISSRIAKALADDRSKMRAQIEDAVSIRTRSLKDRAERWDAVCREVGVSWLDSDELVKAVKLLLSSGVIGTHNSVEGLYRQAASCTERLEKALSEFAALPTSGVDA